MKKKLLALLAIVTVGLSCMTGCNKQLIDWNYKFDKARVNIGGEWVDFDLKTWTDYEDGEQIQLTLKDGTVMVVHSANCILYPGTLPKEN